MLVPRKDLNGRHITNAQCTKGLEQKRRRLAAEEMREIMERAFQAYSRTLELVTSFKYLGWIMAASDDNLLAFMGNLINARKSWACLSRILGRKW